MVRQHTKRRQRDADSNHQIRQLVPKERRRLQTKPLLYSAQCDAGIEQKHPRDCCIKRELMNDPGEIETVEKANRIVKK